MSPPMLHRCDPVDGDLKIRFVVLVFCLLPFSPALADKVSCLARPTQDCVFELAVETALAKTSLVMQPATCSKSSPRRNVRGLTRRWRRWVGCSTF